MKEGNFKVKVSGFWLAIICGALAGQSSFSQGVDDKLLRVGIAKNTQVEFRCDGPVSAVVDGVKSEAKELPPGTYVISLVQSSGDLFRSAPLIAGVVSTPPSELVVLSAPGAAKPGIKVDLIRTPSLETARRAEKDARQKLKGRIEFFQEAGVYVVQTGPFPNQYLANQALQKALSNGFPAAMSKGGESVDGYAAMESAAAPEALNSRRLSAAGQTPAAARAESSVPLPKVEVLPAPPASIAEKAAESAEPVGEVVIPSPDMAADESAAFDESYDSDLPPLDLIPEELLEFEPTAAPSLAPAPEPTPPPPVLEPVPEPTKADLGPELGWVPAPGKGGSKQIVPPPSSPSGKLPSPPQRLAQPRKQQQPPSRMSSPGFLPERKMQRKSQAQPQRSYAPPPQRQGRRPMFAQRPPARPAPSSAPRPEVAEPKIKSAPPQLSEKPMNLPPEPFEQEPPILQPMPSRKPAPPKSYAPPKRTEPRIAEPSAPAPAAPRKEGYAFLPKRDSFRIPNVFKSLPIIRRFWWEKPLVSPSEPPVDMEQSIAKALKEPVPMDESQDEQIAMSGSGSGSETLTEKRSMADEPEREPTDLIPSEPRDLVEPTPQERVVVPYETPMPAELPSEGSAPVLDLPPQPGSSEPGDIEIPSPSTAGGEEPTSIEGPAPAEPKVAAKSAPAGGRAVLAPPTKPLSRGYVQIFDENGQPLTGQAAFIDLIPLSNSRLEYNGNSYHGSFQAYAPSEEWLTLVNSVSVDDYLVGVVPQEIPAEAPFEVLKAQAVMCRCYALQIAQKGENAEMGYDIAGDADSEWPYLGRNKETPNIRLAVEETSNEVLIDSNGEIATPVYCFSSGGYVADARSVWGGTGASIPDYLEAKPDYNSEEVNFNVPAEGFAQNEKLLAEWLEFPPETYDREAAGESFRWKKTYSKEQMNSLVNEYWNNQVGEVKSIEVTQRAISGHATRLTVEGSEQVVEARDSDAIREALQLDSSLFVIDENWRSGWTIYGGGLGHGVGLSQCGAMGLVKKRNANYRQVLNYYFAKLKLGKRDLVRMNSLVSGK